MTVKMHSALRDGLREHALDTLYWKKPAPVIVDRELPVLYRAAADVIGRDEPVLYIEFGVAHGKSMTEVAAIYRHPDARFVGFDSFVGLPEDWLMHKRGAFSNLGRQPLIDDRRVKFVQGWFQNTVPAAMERLSRGAGRKVLIHFDADLYSSTLFLMSTLWFHFDEYYFVFDDFIHDDACAMADFVQAFPVDFEFLIQTRGPGERPSPDHVFGRLSRKDFRIDPD